MSAETVYVGGHFKFTGYLYFHSNEDAQHAAHSINCTLMEGSEEKISATCRNKAQHGMPLESSQNKVFNCPSQLKIASASPASDPLPHAETQFNLTGPSAGPAEHAVAHRTDFYIEVHNFPIGSSAGVVDAHDVGSPKALWEHCKKTNSLETLHRNFLCSGIFYCIPQPGIACL